MILNRENILGAQDFEVTKIPVPRWGGDVCIRPFSAAIKDKIEQCQNDPNYKGSIRSLSLAGSICDEKGNLIFEANAADLKALGSKDLNSVDIVLEKILQINLITEDEISEKSKN